MRFHPTFINREQHDLLDTTVEGGKGDRLENINSMWAMGGREGSGWSRVAFQVILEINLHILALQFGLDSPIRQDHIQM